MLGEGGLAGGRVADLAVGEEELASLLGGTQTGETAMAYRCVQLAPCSHPAHSAQAPRRVCAAPLHQSPGWEGSQREKQQQPARTGRQVAGVHLFPRKGTVAVADFAHHPAT